MAPEDSEAPEKPKVGLSLLLAAIANLERNLEQCRLQIAQVQKALQEQGLLKMEEVAVAAEELTVAATVEEQAEEKLRRLLEATANNAEPMESR